MAELTNRTGSPGDWIRRHAVQGKQAHLCEAQNSMFCTVCRSSSVSQKVIYLTWGDLGLHEMETEKSSDRRSGRGHSSEQDMSSGQPESSHELMKDRTLNCVLIRIGMSSNRDSLPLSGQGKGK